MPGQMPGGETLIIACPACDMLHRLPARHGEDTRPRLCVRCGVRLYSRRAGARSAATAYIVASLVLWVLANGFPIMSLTMAGRTREGLLISGVAGLYQQGFFLLAVAVLLSSVVAPVLRLSGLLYFATHPNVHGRGRIVVAALKPWAMLDVYLLGLAVAVVKLSDIAEVQLLPGAYAFVGLVITTALAASSLSSDSSMASL